MTSHVRNILTTAADTIDKRASDRDLPQERSMAATVTAFNAIFGTNLTESQGWSFMAILKIKRSSTGLYKEDDFVDGAAYMALASEAQKSERVTTSARMPRTTSFNGDDTLKALQATLSSNSVSN